MKLIAFYLPQFHRIPENDQWWGEGFTEWTNTRKAKPLFKNHYQPREPFNDNYYNLLDPDIRNSQAKIAKEYGIYGFCYYHYWFNGRQLLEKPFMEVLKTGEPDFPFCLSWANEPWTRAWYGGENQVIIPQEYGNEKNWEEHFYYLLTAFKDKRYIKIDNKPIFIIYRSESIKKCNEMIDYWNHLARKNSLEGIYFINTLSASSFDLNNKFHAQVEFEPGYTIYQSMPLLWRHLRVLKKKIMKRFGNRIPLYLRNILLDCVDYDYIWSYIVNRKPTNRTTFLGAFVDWDDTARREYNALIIKGASPEKFYKYLKEQISRGKNNYNTEFLFINAWNEWAEGTYLEPDKKFGFRYLEAVKRALSEI